MAKKVKRQVSFNTSSESTVSRPAARVSRPSGDFNPDYTYIKKDLKGLAIQMAVFVGILFILTFFLH